MRWWHEKAIRWLWSNGLDTYAISRVLSISEAKVYNRLAKVRG
jgi:DNA-binding CsgD family transcriptional regulator